MEVLKLRFYILIQLDSSKILDDRLDKKIQLANYIPADYQITPLKNMLKSN